MAKRPLNRARGTTVPEFLDRIYSSSEPLPTTTDHNGETVQLTRFGDLDAGDLFVSIENASLSNALLMVKLDAALGRCLQTGIVSQFWAWSPIAQIEFKQVEWAFVRNSEPQQ